MEDKKFEKLSDLDLEMVSGGTDNVKGSPSYNPLTKCPICGNAHPMSRVSMDGGYARYVCQWCGGAAWFDDNGNLITRNRWG